MLIAHLFVHKNVKLFYSQTLSTIVRNLSLKLADYPAFLSFNAGLEISENTYIIKVDKQANIYNLVINRFHKTSWDLLNRALIFKWVVQA